MRGKGLSRPKFKAGGPVNAGTGMGTVGRKSGGAVAVKRKWGGKVGGKGAEMHLGKAHRARGGRMTPKSPMSGASVTEKGFAKSSPPKINEGGEGEPEGRSRGGRLGDQWSSGSAMREPRARGGSIHIKHPGKLHRDLGVAQGKPIPGDKLAAALHSSKPSLRKEANFASNAKKFNHG